MSFTPLLSSLTERMQKYPDAKSKENHGVLDPMAELTITSPYVHSTPTHLPMGSSMPESTLTLCQSRLYTRIRAME
jgi:hypothetical protein